jgi:hypothetical protein
MLRAKAINRQFYYWKNNEDCLSLDYTSSDCKYLVFFFRILYNSLNILDIECL